MDDVKLGDVVIYTLPEAWHSTMHQRNFPAMVHKLNDDGSADLTVFTNYGQSIFQSVRPGINVPGTFQPSDTLVAD